MPTAPAEQHRGSSSGLDRRSCAWRDAVGPGYAVGAAQRLIEHTGALARAEYCR